MIPCRIDYTQPLHCCGLGDQEPTLSLTTQDGGGGPYLVLNAHEWALGDIEELHTLWRTLGDAWRTMIQAQEAAKEDKESEN